MSQYFVCVFTPLLSGFPVMQMRFFIKHLLAPHSPPRNWIWKPRSIVCRIKERWVRPTVCALYQTDVHSHGFRINCEMFTAGMKGSGFHLREAIPSMVATVVTVTAGVAAQELLFYASNKQGPKSLGHSCDWAVLLYISGRVIFICSWVKACCLLRETLSCKCPR